jgi:hypothetical protein
MAGISAHIRYCTLRAIVSLKESLCKAERIRRCRRRAAGDLGLLQLRSPIIRARFRSQFTKNALVEYGIRVGTIKFLITGHLLRINAEKGGKYRCNL